MSVQNDNKKKNTRTLVVRVLSAGVIISVLLFGGLTFCGGPRISKVRAENMERNVNKIKIGMPKKELKDLLGKPDDYTPKLPFFYDDRGLERASNWSYLYWDDDFSHQIDFDSNTGRVTKSEKVSTGIGIF
jgi:hypothetical protein